jgi:hypothetical protein
VERRPDRVYDLPLVMHPTGTVTRVKLYRMVLIHFFIIAAAIAVSVSVARGYSSFGGSLDSGVTREALLCQRNTPDNRRPVKQFLVVVLPDGKVVNPIVAHRF